MVSLALILLVPQADQFLERFIQSLYYQNTKIQEIPIFILVDPAHAESIKSILDSYQRLNVQWMGSKTDALWSSDNLSYILQQTSATHFLITSDQYFANRDWVNSFQIQLEQQNHHQVIHLGTTHFLPENQHKMLLQAILYSDLWFPKEEKSVPKADFSRDFQDFFLLNACLPRDALSLINHAPQLALEGRILDTYLGFQFWVQGYRFKKHSSAFLYDQQTLDLKIITMVFERQAQDLKSLLPVQPFIVQKILNLNHLQFLDPGFMRQWCIDLEPQLPALTSKLHAQAKNIFSVLSFEQESSPVFQQYVFDLLRYQKYIYFQALIPELEKQTHNLLNKAIYPRQQASIWEDSQVQAFFQDIMSQLTIHDQKSLYEKLDILMAILNPNEPQTALEIIKFSPSISTYLQTVCQSLELTNYLITNESQQKKIFNTLLKTECAKYDWILFEPDHSFFQNISLMYVMEPLLKVNGYLFLNTSSHIDLTELTEMLLAHYPFIACSEYEGHYCKCLMKVAQSSVIGQEHV